jgi:hypothetical protein
MEVHLLMKWEGCGRKQPKEVFNTTTVFGDKGTKKEGIPVGTANMWLRFIPGMQVT